MNQLLAQGTIIGNFESVGNIGIFARDPSGIGALAKFTDILSVVVGFFTICGGLWFIAQIFTGAFSWLASGGDKQAVQNAQKRIAHAIIGLLVVVLSFALISLIGLVFGFNILSPGSILLNLSSGTGGPPAPPTPPCLPGVPC